MRGGDPRAKPTDVGGGVDEMAVVMEQQAKYFDRNCPPHSAILQAVSDPAGATRAVIYGAVRARNDQLPGQRAGRRHEDRYAVAAAVLITSLGMAAERFQALPAGWVVEAVADVAVKWRRWPASSRI